MVSDEEKAPVRCQVGTRKANVSDAGAVPTLPRGDRPLRLVTTSLLALSAVGATSHCLSTHRGGLMGGVDDRGELVAEEVLPGRGRDGVVEAMKLGDVDGGRADRQPVQVSTIARVWAMGSTCSSMWRAKRWSFKIVRVGLLTRLRP